MTWFHCYTARQNQHQCPMRPAKTQISLGVCTDWSGMPRLISSLCTQWIVKDLSFLHVDSEDADQTGWMPGLIWVFAGRTCHFLGFVVLRFTFFNIKTRNSSSFDWLRSSLLSQSFLFSCIFLHYFHSLFTISSMFLKLSHFPRKIIASTTSCYLRDFFNCQSNSSSSFASLRSLSPSETFLLPYGSFTYCNLSSFIWNYHTFIQ